MGNRKDYLVVYEHAWNPNGQQQERGSGQECLPGKAPYVREALGMSGQAQLILIGGGI